MELVVSIIGFGNVGKIIGALLLPYKNNKFTINIIDTDSDTSGAVLDFEHAIQLSEHQLSYNSEELLNQSDFIFHCAGASVPIGKSRLVTSQMSAEITEAIFKNFKPKKVPFIIVVSNPVEIITFITQKVTNLPKENVIGTGTFLDSARMNYIIKQNNTDISSVDALLLGEHGTTAYLSEQLSTVNGLSFRSVFDDDSIASFMKEVKVSAEKIKQTQKATIYGVSYCAIQIFESLLSQSSRKIPVSTYIPAHLKVILGDSNIYLSLYSEVSEKGAHPIESYHPNQNEVERLKEAYELVKLSIPKQYL